MDSDLDVMVLSTDLAAYLVGTSWVRSALGQDALLVRTQEWGPVTERRLRLQSGFEIELDFAPPSWASLEPIDAGSAAVVAHGCKVLYDPDDLLGEFERAVGRWRGGSRTSSLRLLDKEPAAGRMVGHDSGEHGHSHPET